MMSQADQTPRPIAAESSSPSVAAADTATTTTRIGPFAWLIATTRELGSFCIQHRFWTAMMLLFIVTWTIELYWLQAHTLVYPNETSASYNMWAPKIRLALDVLFISGVTFALRRRWLIPTVIASSVIYLSLLTYFKYFHKPISLLTMTTNWREGMHIGGFAWDMFPRGAALLLLLALAIKLAALLLSRKDTMPRSCARLAASVFLVGYIALYAVANRLDPLHYIQTTRGVGRIGHIRGYLGPWFAEWYYLRNDQLLDEMVEQRKVVYDALSPLEADIPIHPRLVIVQAESLDNNILDFTVNGEEVTPFLNGLRRESMYYRVGAMHFLGSADADFAALTGVAGSRRANSYSIPGYPYQNTTPQMLENRGFDIYAFHGYSGEFYSRRSAYVQMGFTKINFQEELEAEYELPTGQWGVNGRDVMRLSAELLNDAKPPVCHFLITLTTHTPYKQLPPTERELFLEPASTAEQYLNNMRYLDNCLREYLAALGDGTTVVIYADHPTEVFTGFTPDRDLEMNREFVPCLIYDSDRDLSKLQKTRDEPVSTDGSLNLVDFINYVRGQVERNFPPVDESPAETSSEVPLQEQST